MTVMSRFLTLFVALLCAGARPQAGATYTNPVGETPVRMGDPFVLQHAGKYYLFGTTAVNTGFQYWTSEDLVHWKAGGWAYRKTEDSWTDGMLWAPEVKFYRGRFYMTYSGRVRGTDPALWKMLIGLAVSDTPEGPYRDLHAPWFDAGYSAIDGHIFVDSDGAPYLYFSRNGSQDGYSYGVNYGVALSQDLSKPLGEPVRLTEADQPWERINWARNRCNEGPSVLKHNGRYYMTYSANSTGAPGYGVGYAVAEKPLGPWVKSRQNPVLASNLEIGVSSPGHNSITMSPDGKEMFVVYHAHADPSMPGGARVVYIDRLQFDDTGSLRILGPTRSPQPMPSGAH
jgi:beta-xylosidase